jgi:hypothetical protein
MRTIYCIEFFEPLTEQKPEPIVKFRAPFDVLPDGLDITTLAELKEAISEIECPHTRTATENRLWFLFNRQFINHFFKVNIMNWKWDEEYYRNLKPSSAKGADTEDF